MSKSRHDEIVEVENAEGEKVRMKILEIPIDPPNTVKRILVPANTKEEDTQVGSRLLDERETDGHLARASRPEEILVGDSVRLYVPQDETPNDEQMRMGTVDAKMRSGKVRVKWETGKATLHETKELRKVW